MAQPLALLSDCTDVSTFGDDGSIGVRFSRRIRGVRCVLEWVARRWFSRPGALVWEPGTRVDLADMVNADPPAAVLRDLERVMQEEAVLVPFVKRAVVSAVLDGDGVLQIKAAVEVVGEGVYPVIVTIDKAKAAVRFPKVAA